jgi:hypothetical protein
MAIDPVEFIGWFIVGFVVIVGALVLMAMIGLTVWWL